jgi:hypothetical protein
MAASSDGTTSSARRRGPGRRWPPGVSGNPRGRRPALPPDLVALKAQHGPEFLGQLVSLTRSPDEKIRVRALPLALEYSYGRAPVIVDVAMPPPSPMSSKSMLTLTWDLRTLNETELWQLRALAARAVGADSASNLPLPAVPTDMEAGTRG